MTFLELCQRVSVLSGIAGPGPSTVSNPTNVNAKTIRFTSDAWRKIQALSDSWLFMEKEGSIDTVIGTQSYSAATLLAANANYGTLKKKTVKYADGSGRLSYINYSTWKENNYDLSTQPGKPNVFTVKPDGSVLLLPIPDRVFTLNFNFRRSPQVLAANNDIPDCPEEHHDAIVYRALMLAFEHDQAAPEYKSVKDEYDEWMARMVAKQLPEVKNR